MKIELRLGQNWPISPNISTTTEPVFTNISALVDVYMRIIKTDIGFTVVQERCYRNQLILGDFCQCQN